MSQESDNVTRWTHQAEDRKSVGFVDMCDTFDYDHYPVFYGGPDDDYKTAAEVVAAKDGKNMQRAYGTYEV